MENEKKPEQIDCGRRTAIKKLALGVGVLAGISVLPERWTRPIIGQIVLPVHAQTSGGGCTVNPGCYLIASPPLFAGQYIAWPGGSGFVANVGVHSSAGCTDTSPSIIPLVLAASFAEAEIAFGGPGGVTPLDVAGAPAGCVFYTQFN